MSAASARALNSPWLLTESGVSPLESTAERQP